MVQDAWKNFEMTGTVADYLTYRQSADYGECAEMKTESLGSERGIGSYGTEHSSDGNGVKRHAYWGV